MTPTTKAGRALLAKVSADWDIDPWGEYESARSRLVEDILAIEREAAAEAEALRAALTRLHSEAMSGRHNRSCLASSCWALQAIRRAQTSGTPSGEGLAASTAIVPEASSISAEALRAEAIATHEEALRLRMALDRSASALHAIGRHEGHVAFNPEQPGFRGCPMTVCQRATAALATPAPAAPAEPER